MFCRARRAPLIERRAVEADDAARGLPYADEGARERRFAGAARADHAERAARGQRDTDIMQHRGDAARRRDADEARRSDCAGAGSGVRSVSAGVVASASESRRQLCRAAMKLRQLAMTSSTGASARAVRIMAARMMPTLAC